MSRATRPTTQAARPRCPTCGGSGYDPLLPPDDLLGSFDCYNCDGTGYDQRMPEHWLPPLLADYEDNTL